MKICRFCYSFILFIFILMTGCIEPYPPPVIDGEVNYLVVDGSVDSESGSVTVTLTRAVPLASTELSPPELNADVSLEDNDGNTYSLNETTGGLYQQSNLSIDASKEYRLYIKTSDNTEYRSDFITIKQTPVIDSITWAPTQKRDGIEIYVNTHDDTKNTRYYQWSYEETYQYEAAYFSYLKIADQGAVPIEVIPIPNEETTFRCWRTIPSQKILISSSDRLNQDIIQHFPLTIIPKGSQKLTIKYSILVKQKALTRQAYDYWLNLQKTTERLGTLFDPQPGQVTGNIHSVSNSNTPVIGYFDVGAAQVKRLFIGGNEIPTDIRTYGYTGGCSLDTVLTADLATFDAYSYALVNPINQSGPVPIGYEYTIKSCTDCRVQGGVTTKPDFWE